MAPSAEGQLRIAAQPNGRSPGERLRIIVLGYLIRGPLGGVAWCVMQYFLGLSRLGHDVYFLEDSGDYPACYDPDRDVTDTDPTYGLRFAARAFERLGLGDRWAYFDAHSSRWLGPCPERVRAACATADLLLVVGAFGASPLRPWVAGIPVRALLDLDPAFTQIQHLTDPNAMAEAQRHTVFFSIGMNIASGRSSVPDDGFPWQPYKQPVVLDAWAPTAAPLDGPFTTVMQWDSYESRAYGGRHYGMKSESFGPYADLPTKAEPILELALGAATDPQRRRLADKGWIIRDSREPTRDPWTYQAYIRASKAEFAIAKHGYVISRGGWFSERSVSYLASGRPVLAQDTGFSAWLPVGSGVVAFSTPDEALAGIEEINSRYEMHCRAAREIAAEFFDARKVLATLVESAMSSSSSAARGRVGDT